MSEYRITPKPNPPRHSKTPIRSTHVPFEDGFEDFEDDFDNEEDWPGRHEDERYTCQCRFCFCMDYVELAGDVCESCRVGAHQG